MIQDTQSAQISKKQDEKCWSAGIAFNFRTSLQSFFILKFNSVSALPTYCNLHLVHSIKYMVYLLLQCLLLYLFFHWYQQYVTEHHVPKWMSCHCDDNREDTLFSWLHIYYGHLASVRFEHSVSRESLITTHIMLLAWLAEQSFVHWYQQCVTVHHVPKWMSCHKATVVITGRARCFHDYIYITVILLL